MWRKGENKVGRVVERIKMGWSGESQFGHEVVLLRALGTCMIVLTTLTIVLFFRYYSKSDYNHFEFS